MYPVFDYIGGKQICKDVPLTFPPQHQESQPGLEYLMNPIPISDYEGYIGSGKLQGKVAIITGGDSGIGRAVSIAFAKEGADIAIVYLNEEIDANETKRMVESYGRRCLLIQKDLRFFKSAQEVVRDVLNVFGSVHILVNNIGVQFIQNSILDITEQQLLDTFMTNVFSYFYMIQAILPFLHRGDTIINTTSVTAYQGHKQLIDYSATKGAIVSLTRSLSQSLIPDGIRVNAVAPGPIWTPLIPASFSKDEVSTFGAYTSYVPMMRAGQPYEMAPSYVFLASDDSSYMTGQVLHPNGGTIVDS